MQYLTVNVFDDRSVFTFDPPSVAGKIRDHFLGADFDPRDKLQEQLEKAKASCDESTPAGRIVLDTLRRNISALGPALEFWIPYGEGSFVDGVVKRHLLQFGLPENANESLIDRLEEFAKSIVPKRIKIENTFHSQIPATVG